MGESIECCSPIFWVYLLIVAGLVCFAGLMSGLTLGLLSLELRDLQVLIKSGKPKARQHAEKILPVVRNGHLLLCTLLIGNALAMEALPIFLDSLVPAWGAILISVTLILVFGEIFPQAVCSRYGLAVGATVVPIVRVFLFLFFPIAYPISKILDWLLGKGHVVLFRRAELKTLVDMHGNEAGMGGELTYDETTIIGGALTMTEKTAVDAMTPISKTFSLSADAKLDMHTVNLVMTKGHSRVPVYSGSSTNIIGVLLVKSLLAIRPEDGRCVRNLTIRTTPRVPDHMPLYDILNEFQKGHSHIAVVVKYSKGKMDLLRRNDKKQFTGPMDSISVTMDLCKGIRQVSGGNASHHSATLSHTECQRQDYKQGGISFIPLKHKNRNHKGTRDIIDIEQGCLPCFPDNEEVVGIITMEDVIEELLQEEILDETDEYIDMHKKIKFNMVASGRSPLLSSSMKHHIGNPSHLSSFRTTLPSALRVSSFRQAPITVSPFSFLSHVPGSKAFPRSRSLSAYPSSR